MVLTASADMQNGTTPDYVSPHLRELRPRGSIVWLRRPWLCLLHGGDAGHTREGDAGHAERRAGRRRSGRPRCPALLQLLLFWASLLRPKVTTSLLLLLLLLPCNGALPVSWPVSGTARSPDH